MITPGGQISPVTEYIRHGRPSAFPKMPLPAKMQVCGVGLGREAISRIETGDRFVTDYELAIFARVLGVSLEWLTGDLEQKE